MNKPKVEGSSLAGQESLAREVWLLGQPPLHNYLKFVEAVVVDGAATPRSRLVDEWPAANDYYGELGETAAGCSGRSRHRRSRPRRCRHWRKRSGGPQISDAHSIRFPRVLRWSSSSA